MNFKIHKEGYPTIFLIFFVLVIINCLLIDINQFLKIFIYIVSLSFLIFIISFFRIPYRKMIKDDNLIYSPADGKVVEILEVTGDEYSLNKCWQISVFMSPLNVHQNLSPIEGEVVYSQYYPGKYLVAWHPKSSTLNERWSMVIQHNNGLVLCKQIAGFLARRIVNYPNVGQNLKQAEEYGFIKFGSRVDVLIPIDCTPLVSINEKVKGGLTALAKWK